MPEPNLPPPDINKFTKSPEELAKVPKAEYDKAVEAFGRGPYETPPSLPAYQIGTSKRWLDRLPSLSIGYVRPSYEPKAPTEPRHWGGLGFSLDRTEGWGCAALSALYLALGLIGLGGSCYVLSPQQQETNTTAGSARVAMSPITATFSPATKTTTYRVQMTAPDAAEFRFVWTNTNPCGSFSGNGPVADWVHPDLPGVVGACPSETVHPGTIIVLGLDGQYTCKALYSGSAAGVGQPATCEGKPAPVAQSTSSDSTHWALWIGWPVGAVILLGFGGWLLSPYGPRGAALPRFPLSARRGEAVVGAPTVSTSKVEATDPCAAEKAYVAELRARIAARDAELGPSVKRGDTYLPPALRETIAEDLDTLAKAEAALARCLGTAAPGDASGAAPGALTPAPTGTTSVPATVPGQGGAPGTGGGGVTFSPPIPPTPPPIPHTPDPPPQLHTPCTEGETMPPETKCEAVGDLWFLSRATVDVDGAFMFGEEDVNAALQGLDTAFDAIGVGTGLIEALTNPVGTILGLLGVPGPDSITTVPRDAAMQGLEKLNKKFSGLRRWGRWKVTIPKETCRFSCVWQQVCRNGNWAVEKGVHMKREGNATTTSWEEDVNSPQDAQRFLARLTALVTARNKETNDRFDNCAKLCM